MGKKEKLLRELEYVENSNFHYFIRKILKDIDKEGDASISKDVLEIIDGMIFSMFNDIATLAKRNMIKSRGESLSSLDIQTAVKAVLKNGVSKHAEIGGITATKNFEIVTGQKSNLL
ncbi:hypothetical protein CDAR_261361 [Caerostris darwini]|uniref:Histone H2B n=1 Tax=Caerostris darwini TaxID=1538125 RepID=A0AAV4ST73_9ARAC|nr:hypothetical protein CDAR_261361 [Caerostris darwini]